MKVTSFTFLPLELNHCVRSLKAGLRKKTGSDFMELFSESHAEETITGLITISCVLPGIQENLGNW